MSEHDVGRRSDRSYLCLVAIYVIHALLLNVFLQPQFDVRNSVTLSSHYVRSMSKKLWTLKGNASDSIIARINVHGEDNEVFSSTKNVTKSPDRKEIDDDYDDYSVRSSTNAFLHSSKSGEAAIRFLTSPKTSRVSRVTIDALSAARSIVKNLSPAAWGILSGCLVFLLTFTENDYV